MKMKKSHLLALAGILILGFTGCEKAKVQNEATVDVFIKSIKNDQGTTVYSPLHTVYSYNGSLTAASVKAPDGTITQLTSDPNDPGFSFYTEPDEADYSATLPATAAGIYTYTVKFDDGEEKIYTNALSSFTLLPANITSLVESADKDTIYISWEVIANAQAYQLKVMSGTTRVYATYPFTSQSLKIAIPRTSLSSSNSGVYRFHLSGLYYESTTSYNVQAISTAEKDITL